MCEVSLMFCDYVMMIIINNQHRQVLAPYHLLNIIQPWCFFFKTIASHQQTLRYVLKLCEYAIIIIINNKAQRSIRQYGT